MYNGSSSEAGPTLKPHLSGSQDDGGELRAVAPLGQEGESEGLHEDGRDDALPAPLGDRGRRAHLHIWGPVDQLRALELSDGRHREGSKSVKRIPVSALHYQTLPNDTDCV